jgi:insulysin
VVVEKFSQAPNRHLTPPKFNGSPLTEAELSVSAAAAAAVRMNTADTVSSTAIYSRQVGKGFSNSRDHLPLPRRVSPLRLQAWILLVPPHRTRGQGIGSQLLEGQGMGQQSLDRCWERSEWIRVLQDQRRLDQGRTWCIQLFSCAIDGVADSLYADNHEAVTSAIFAYISLLKSSPPQEWAFREVSSLSSLGFRFKEKSPPTSTAMSLSLQMSKPYPRDVLLSAPWLSSEWNPAVLQEIMGYLDPKQCRIMISSQAPIEGKTYGEKEKWYGTEYTIVPTSEKILNVSSCAMRDEEVTDEIMQGTVDAGVDYSELALPKPNSFIPANLEIKNRVDTTEVRTASPASLPCSHCRLQPAKRPLSLRNTPVSRLWHKKDDRWWVPRAGAFFLMRSPLIDDTPLHAVQSRLFTELIRDSLVEYSYDADLAGLSYTFDSQADGILLTIDGYDDKLEVLSKVVFDTIKTLKVDKKRFDIIVDQVRPILSLVPRH